jgi:hypothetical protein
VREREREKNTRGDGEEKEGGVCEREEWREDRLSELAKAVSSAHAVRPSRSSAATRRGPEGGGGERASASASADQRSPKGKKKKKRKGKHFS